MQIVFLLVYGALIISVNIQVMLQLNMSNLRFKFIVLMLMRCSVMQSYNERAMEPYNKLG